MRLSKLVLIALTATALSACGTLSNSPSAQPTVKKAPAPPAPPGGKPAPELTPQDIQRIQQQLNKRAS